MIGDGWLVSISEALKMRVKNTSTFMAASLLLYMTSLSNTLETVNREKMAKYTKHSYTLPLKKRRELYARTRCSLSLEYYQPWTNFATKAHQTFAKTLPCTMTQGRHVRGAYALDGRIARAKMNRSPVWFRVWYLFWWRVPGGSLDFLQLVY